MQKYSMNVFACQCLFCSFFLSRHVHEKEVLGKEEEEKTGNARTDGSADPSHSDPPEDSEVYVPSPLCNSDSHYTSYNRL